MRVEVETGQGTVRAQTVKESSQTIPSKLICPVHRTNLRQRQTTLLRTLCTDCKSIVAIVCYLCLSSTRSNSSLPEISLLLIYRIYTQPLLTISLLLIYRIYTQPLLTFIRDTIDSH